MALFGKKGARVLWLDPECLRPNPDQPRRSFDPQALEELAASIRVHGILQPLTVRREEDGGYTLVAGERRLRAALLAGLKEVPCLPAAYDRKDAALLALVENLQRRDLDWWEEAAALDRLVRVYGLSQEQAAEQVGKSQPAVSNKLRLLQLSPDLIDRLRSGGLSERHARALLRLKEEDRSPALQVILDRKLNVAAAEAYIESLLARPEPARRKRPMVVLKDVRLFLNTLSRGVTALKDAGVDARWEQEDRGDSITLTISIPKSRSRAAG